MKFLLTIAYVLSCYLLWGQEIPPKGTNCIQVSLALSEVEAYKEAGRFIVDKGFVIEQSDKDLGTISTNPKPLNAGNQYMQRITVNVREGKVFFAAQHNLTTSFASMMNGARVGTWVPMQYLGGKKDKFDNVMFMRLSDIAQAFATAHGGTVSYLTR